jgi:hypothetical protein
MDQLGRHGSGGAEVEEFSEFTDDQLDLHHQAKSLRSVRLVYCDGDLVDLLYSLLVSLATFETVGSSPDP